MSTTIASRLRRLRRRILAFIRENQWALPLLGAITGVALGLLLFQVDRAPEDGWTITVSQSRATLASLVVLMFTILSLSLSLTTIALDGIASQFSIRLVTVAISDYRTKLATSVFAGATTFIGVELFKLTDLASDDLTPRIPFAVAIFLMLCSGVALFWQLNYTIQSLRLEHALARLQHFIDRAVKWDERRFRGWEPAPSPPADDGHQVLAMASGYVTDLNTRSLGELAERHGLTTVIVRRLGDAVVTGEPIGRVGPNPSPERLEEVSAAVQIESTRDAAHDVELGIRILVDIASLALSPAVNDPYTAVQVLDRLSIVFADLAGRRLGPRSINSPDGRSAWVAAPTVAELLEVPAEELRRYGAAEPTVMGALTRLFDTVERTVTGEAERRAVEEVRRELLGQ